VREALVRAGLDEIRPAPFVSEDDLEMVGTPGAVRIANPLRAEEGWLRADLLPGLVRAVARNRALGVQTVALFEVGSVFGLDDPVEEHRRIGVALWGSASGGWYEAARTFDAVDARGVLETLCEELAVDGWTLEGPAGAAFHPSRSAGVVLNGEGIGVLGELHPSLAAAHDVDGRVALLELALEPLMAAAGPARFRDLPRFPPLRRDLAFVVPDDVRAGDVRSTIEVAGGELVDAITLFDVWRGPSIGEARKSLAFAVAFRAKDRTLTDDEIDERVEAISAMVAERFGGSLRTT
jgi:phenylalanyl-tRNA synthetase beta chain